MTFQICFRRISKVEKSHRFGNVLGLSVITVFLALAGAEAEQNATPDWEKTIPVCRDGHPLLLPLIPHLRIAGEKITRNEANRGSDADIVWQGEDPPVQLKAFSFSQRQSDRNRVPLFDALWGYEKPYAIQELKLGTFSKSRIENWPEPQPTYHMSVSGTLRFVPPDLKLFGHPLTMTCFHGLPLYSNDDETRSCQASGLGPEGMVIRFDFNTGSDLAGHWPVTKNDWVSQNWTGMSKSLAEIERLVEFMRVSGNEKFKCN
jgi:hypothetical protein